jgi:hypothetical protein
LIEVSVRSFRHSLRPVLTLILLGFSYDPAFAQTVEAVGTRALGMGGAFVAVADDSSASWWNPAGLAAGPFLDVAIARNGVAIDGTLPASRTGTWSFTLGTPPFGVSYYRLRITDIAPLDPTAQGRAGREDREAGAAVRSLSLSQFGATVLHTVLTGVHIGSTVKYVRGTARASAVPGPDAVRLDIPELLDLGDDLEGGEGYGTVDLDIGALAVVGALRAGVVVRNLREPSFDGITVPRQVRIGGAFDGEATGMLPLMVSLDADLRGYDAGAGERRVVAIGAEHWVVRRRVAVRGGARFNTIGATDRAVTAGASVAPRAGLFVDGYLVQGGDTGEGGWGVAARVSF